MTSPKSKPSSKTPKGEGQGHFEGEEVDDAVHELENEDVSSSLVSSESGDLSSSQRGSAAQASRRPHTLESGMTKKHKSNKSRLVERQTQTE